MQVRILAFASAAEALGASRLELEVPEDTDLAQLAEILGERAPALRAHLPRLAFAVDGTLRPRSAVLAAGCEVALLPPVSGG